MNKRLLILLLFPLLFCANLQAQDLERLKDIKDIKKKKPFDFGGSIGIGASYYNSNAAIKRVAPYNWFINGSPFMRIYGLTIPFSFTYSETGRSLTHPFHYQFTGASPYYKWGTAHIGFRSMTFSDYTVNGVVFNGFGLELKPGKLRFGAFYGVFNPAVEIDNSIGDFGVILPSYKRIGYGAKLGFGTDKNFFDFNIFRGKDVVNSLQTIPEFEILKPVDNIVFGPKFKFTFFKRMFIESDFALSVLTRNVLNDTLKETEDLKMVYQFIRVNTTSYGAFAGHVSTGINFKNWGFNVRARQVSSDFQSLGINLLQDDIRDFTFNPTLSIIKGKINLSGSYGFYTDNISNKRLNTTVRSIYNSNISVRASQRANFSLGYSNFGTTRTNGIVQMNDSITFSIINSSYTGNINLNVGKLKQPTFVSLFVQYQLAEDRNIFTAKFNNSEVLNVGLNTQYKIKTLQLQVGGGVSYAHFFAGGSNFTTNNAQLSFRRPFFKKKLTTGINVGFSTRYKEAEKQGNIASLGLSSQVKLGKHHNISMQLRLMRNTTGIVSNTAFNEQRFSINYGFSF